MPQVGVPLRQHIIKDAHHDGHERALDEGKYLSFVG